jgi:hypothetical protein
MGIAVFSGNVRANGHQALASVTYHTPIMTLDRDTDPSAVPSACCAALRGRKTSWEASESLLESI